MAEPTQKRRRGFTGSTDSAHLVCGCFEDLIAFTDADWGASEDKRSTSGLSIYSYGCPIYWKSTKQKCVASSTQHAELIAACLGAREVMYFQRLLRDFELYDGEGRTLLYIDNESTIKTARNGGGSNSYENIQY